MAPIRVGLIGLSTPHGNANFGIWAASTHLPALQKSPDYKVVALANSTIESAERSIAFHNLPSSTKAYGSAEDLANDKDIDLVVVCVRVQRHLELVKPALLNRKNVFVEWPLAANLDEVEYLTKLGKESGVQAVVGLQSRAAPITLKLKNIVASGQIGRILSSNVLASSSQLGMDTWPQDGLYYLDMNSGGNEFYIIFGHLLDSCITVLGDFSEVQTILKSHYETVPIVDSDGQVVDSSYRKTSPDHILVQGITELGAVASLSVRKPPATADGVGIRWVISGTLGEIIVTGPGLWHVMDKEAHIQVKIGNEPVQDIDFQSYRVPLANEVAPFGANVASLYDALAKGDNTKYATFESAARTHRLLERIRKAAGPPFVRE
ncbi:NAD(P)-binding domain protein [Metarhizium brunneum]